MGVLLVHVSLDPDLRQVVNLEQGVFATDHLTGHDVETGDPAGRRGADRNRLHQLGTSAGLRQVGLLQSLDGFGFHAEESKLSLEGFDPQRQRLEFALLLPHLPLGRHALTAQLFQPMERLLDQPGLRPCLEQFKLNGTKLETVQLHQHVARRHLLARPHMDATDTAFDLRRHQRLPVGRQLDRAVSHGDHRVVLLPWIGSSCFAVDAGLVFVAQQGRQQGIAHDHDLIAGKCSVEHLNETVFGQPELHAAVLVLSRHPLHQQVGAGAAADDRIGRAGNRFLGHLDRDPHSAGHSRPQPAVGILHGNHHALRAPLRVHLQPQMIDLAAKFLARQRRRSLQRPAGRSPESERPIPEHRRRSRASSDRRRDRDGPWR